MVFLGGGNYTIAFLNDLRIFRCGLNLRHTIRKEGDSMNIGIIGAGKVGFTLGKFFSQGGIRITGYFSRNPESARAAAAFTHSSFYDTLQPLIEESDAIFITVPDRAIPAVFQQVRQFESLPEPARWSGMPHADHPRRAENPLPCRLRYGKQSGLRARAAKRRFIGLLRLLPRAGR